MERLFGRGLASRNVAWVQSAVGPVWKLDLANVTHRWIVYGFYEGPSLWRWLSSVRNSIRTIVDSGANIGQTVLHFAALTPRARIFAYEPGSAARDWLQLGVEANHLVQVSVCAAGLGANRAGARLRDDGGANRHGSWNKVSSSEGEPIELVPLDEEIARLGLDSIDLWKLDMEGYELSALRGATRALTQARIRAIYIETTGETGRENLSLLTAHGYRIHGIAPSGDLVTWNPSHDYENALCLAPGYFDH